MRRLVHQFRSLHATDAKPHRPSIIKIAAVTFLAGLTSIAGVAGSSHLVSAGDNGQLQPPAATAYKTPDALARPAAQASAASLPTDNRYVALGDSVAAGAGLPVTTANGTAAACQRSDQAYPPIVAQARGLDVVHVACSGATATNLLLWQGVNQAPNPNRQISYIFAGSRPQLVSITAGANDIRWAYFVNKCRTSTCGPDVRQGFFTNSRTDTDIVNGLLAALQIKYDAFFAELALRSGGNPPTVAVTGYYNPFSNACLQQFPSISPAELRWLNASLSALNQTIRQTVERYPNARFVPLDFSGHDLCSADSWVQGLSDKAPLHPTAQGQQAIAQAVLAAKP